MPSRKRMRVVTAQDNPKPSRTLTSNEVKARKMKTGRKLYATTTSMGGMGRTADTLDSSVGNFYSPQLSSDFLEKPQNLRERRAFYRFFYNTHEIVGAAIDLHSTLPLSKIRLVPPKSSNKAQNEYVFKYFEKMCERMRLFKTLMEVSHEYYLFGNAFLFSEQDEWKEKYSEEEVEQKEEESKQRKEFLKTKHDVRDKDPLFMGWKKILVLPPDQVRVRKLPLTDDVAIEFVPDPETRRVLTSEGPMAPGAEGDKTLNYEIPSTLKEKLRMSGSIPLDTNPYTGSHVYHLSRKKSQYEPLGQSIVERCINTLILEDKIRQAQTSIASRHMTPMRIVWAEELNNSDVDSLREQVDLALVDPDYSIVANYQINWEEMGSNGRLLDLSVEYEHTDNRIMTGMGVTREMLTGEGSYSGSRVGLEIMNQQYLLFREVIQEYVEEYLFKPIAKKKGFIAFDKFGNEELVYPRLGFSRLSIRDNDTYFDAVFQLYQKGSVSIDVILDLLNIDPESTREKIEKDMFTVNDNQFNEILRNVYTNAATNITDQTDIVEKLAKYMGLNIVEPEEVGEEPEGDKRFSSESNPKSNPKSDPKSVKDINKKLVKVMSYFKKNPQLLDKVFKK